MLDLICFFQVWHRTAFQLLHIILHSFEHGQVVSYRITDFFGGRGVKSQWKCLDNNWHDTLLCLHMVINKSLIDKHNLSTYKLTGDIFHNLSLFEMEVRHDNSKNIYIFYIIFRLRRFDTETEYQKYYSFSCS
jgi:hypothetical protein